MWGPLLIKWLVHLCPRQRWGVLSALPGVQSCSISFGCKWQVKGSPSLSGTEETSCILRSDILEKSLTEERYPDIVKLKGRSVANQKHSHREHRMPLLLSLPCLSQTNSRILKYCILKCLGGFFIVQRTTNYTFSSCHNLYLQEYMSVHKNA